MSLDKAIKSGKEHRKPYYDSRDFDSSCRNHGGCPWCEGNRLHKQRLLELRIQEALQFETNWSQKEENL